MRLSEAERVETRAAAGAVATWFARRLCHGHTQALACKGSHASQGTFQESMPVTLLLRCHKELRLSITITIA